MTDNFCKSIFFIYICNMETKVCIKCNTEKDVTEFYSGRRPCKNCYNKGKKKEDPDHVKKRRRKYYIENREKELECGRKWKRENPERVVANNKRYKETYVKNRIESDPIYGVRCSVRNLIKCSIYHKGYTKKSRTFEILGCSYKEFKEHIESQFEDWMNWDNYGMYNGKGNCGWEYDHIIPVSSAKCEEDIIRLNHHSNIQPLCSYVNRHVKRDIIDWKS